MYLYRDRSQTINPARIILINRQRNNSVSFRDNDRLSRANNSISSDYRNGRGESAKYERKKGVRKLHRRKREEKERSGWSREREKMRQKEKEKKGWEGERRGESR